MGSEPPKVLHVESFALSELQAGPVTSSSSLKDTDVVCKVINWRCRDV